MTDRDLGRELLKYTGFAIVVASLLHGSLASSTDYARAQPDAGHSVSEPVSLRTQAGADG